MDATSEETCSDISPHCYSTEVCIPDEAENLHCLSFWDEVSCYANDCVYLSDVCLNIPPNPNPPHPPRDSEEEAEEENLFGLSSKVLSLVSMIIMACMIIMN